MDLTDVLAELGFAQYVAELPTHERLGLIRQYHSHVKVGKRKRVERSDALATVAYVVGAHVGRKRRALVQAVTVELERANRLRDALKRAGSPEMQLSVVTLTGKRIPINTVHAYDSIFVLKQRVQDREGIPPDQQHLIFAGRMLTNDETLMDCGITTGHTLHLVLALRGD